MATAAQLAARKKFVAMVKAKKGKAGGKKPVVPSANKTTAKTTKGKMPMIGGKPAWLAKKGK